MTTIISPEAQAIIDRLAAHAWKRERIDRKAVEIAVNRHLTELALPARPFHWSSTAKEGWGAAWDAARGAARVAARDAARDAAWDAARDAARVAARDAARDAAWDAARDAGEVNALSAFNHPAQAKLAAVWLPMIDAFNSGLWLYWITPVSVICVEQPSIHTSDNRLHRADGPAVWWPAGEEYYFWRGVQIPGDWISKPAALTAKIALTWKNIEQRRAACEIIGWSKILSELDAKTIDEDGDPEIGRLVEVNIPDSGHERFLLVRCGTGRNFALPVPRNMKTAIQAQAWTWGLNTKTFTRPEVRT